MAKRYHPDVCDVEEDIDMFLRAKAAYETLSAASGYVRAQVDVGVRGWTRVVPSSFHPSPTHSIAANATTARLTTRHACSHAPRHRTCLDTVQTYEWKLKWRAQLEKLRAERAEAERARREREGDNRISLVGTREMKNQIASQMAGLRDQTRKRRNVMKPKVSAFVEPFADIRASDDDEWNHEVQ